MPPSAEIAGETPSPTTIPFGRRHLPSRSLSNAARPLFLSPLLSSPLLPCSPILPPPLQPPPLARASSLHRIASYRVVSRCVASSCVRHSYAHVRAMQQLSRHSEMRRAKARRTRPPFLSLMHSSTLRIAGNQFGYLIFLKKKEKNTMYCPTRFLRNFR